MRRLIPTHGIDSATTIANNSIKQWQYMLHLVKKYLHQTWLETYRPCFFHLPGDEVELVQLFA